MGRLGIEFVDEGTQSQTRTRGQEGEAIRVARPCLTVTRRHDVVADDDELGEA